MRLFSVFLFMLIMLSAFSQDSWLAPKSAVNIINPYAGNKIAAQKGQALYSKLCWTCHGKNGKAMALLLPILNPNLRDFSSVDLQKQTDGELFWKLSNGKGMMVPYKHSLNEEKRWQLINYIRTLSVN